MSCQGRGEYVRAQPMYLFLHQQIFLQFIGTKGIQVCLYGDYYVLTLAFTSRSRQQTSGYWPFSDMHRMHNTYTFRDVSSSIGFHATFSASGNFTFRNRLSLQPPCDFRTSGMLCNNHVLFGPRSFPAGTLSCD